MESLSAVFVEYDENGENRSLTFDLQTTDALADTVVVSQFSENPFPMPILGQSTRIRVRVEIGDVTRHFSATVRVLSNPFAGRHFAFLTYGSSGQ